MWPIFTFVAIWHDIELKLLVWGWLISLFILPEYILTYYVSPRLKRIVGPYFHLHLCALGGSFNAILMVTANLIGFAVGVNGMMKMLSRIAAYNALQIILTAVAFLFCGVHVMFELERKREYDAKMKNIKSDE